MPNRKAEKKSLVQNEKRRVRNHAVKSSLRTLTVKIRNAVDAKEKEQAEALLKSMYSLYDKAVKKGVVKINTASRNKSKFTAQVNSL